MTRKNPKSNELVIGKLYGGWTALDKPIRRPLPGSKKTPPTEALMVYCQCSCGAFHYVKLYSLLAGASKSCKKCISWLGVPAYIRDCHYSMITRCYDPIEPAYKYYGYRGIGVSPEWFDIYTFYKDMGPKPNKNYSLDRIDNDGDYCKNNCRWASKSEQLNNTRRNIVIDYQGETKTLTEWSRFLDIKYDTLRARLKKGWEGEKLFRKPNWRK